MYDPENVIRAQRNIDFHFLYSLDALTGFLQQRDKQVCQLFGALKLFAEVYSITTLCCDFAPSMLICNLGQIKVKPLYNHYRKKIAVNFITTGRKSNGFTVCTSLTFLLTSPMMSFRPMVWILLVIPALLMATSIDVEKLFNQLPSDPEKLVFLNEIPINNEGGHLQGVQPYYFKGKEYIFFSGSSSTYGYLAVAQGAEVRKLHRLMFKPFKHAGGFQIHRDWLAVGVEDNDARNASVVHVYKLGDPLSDLKEPGAVIKRSGERERATAGAVAIHQLEETLWVVVGDWGNRHMDFYKADISTTDRKIQFQKTGEVDMTNHSKDGWIDPVARSFQNINLFRMEDQLCLVGMAGDENSNGNVIDVFTVDDLSGSSPVLTKIYSRKFKANPDTRFRWGAGMSFDGQDRLSLYSCGGNITSAIAVSVYR